MPKFQIVETIHSEKITTVRLGTNTVANNGGYTDKDVGKAVKLVGESRYALCAAGDKIEGFINSVEPGTFDGYSYGGIVKSGYKAVTFDGLQATAGTGEIAVGDYVVCGTVVAAGTALSAPLKVTKATIQPGTSTASAVGDVDDHVKAGMSPLWRVVSLGSAGTGAVGTVGVIERV